MMLRSNRPWLGVTGSQDHGATWSPVRRTRFTDNGSGHQFGRLPDGQYVALSTPRPDPMWTRTPLVLSLRRGGKVFGRHVVIGDAPAEAPRIGGMHKGGRNGYPHLAVAGRWVVAAYSVNKEDIRLVRFPTAVCAR